MLYSNPQPLLDGLQELQAKFKLASRFQGLARVLGTGNPSADLRTAGLTLINALLATPDDVDQRSKLRAEIEASGVRSLLVLWKGLNDSSMKLQLRNYAEAVEFDETSAASARSVHMSPRATPDANLRVLIVRVHFLPRRT